MLLISSQGGQNARGDSQMALGRSGEAFVNVSVPKGMDSTSAMAGPP